MEHAQYQGRQPPVLPLKSSEAGKLESPGPEIDAMSETRQLPEISLFEKIGGAEAVAALVDRFYDLVTKDPMLEPYFNNVSMDKLRRMQFEFFSAALGGPVQYTGRPIVHAHHHLRITLMAFQRFVQHLFGVMSQYGLTEQECYDIISRLNLYTNDVVSAGTGLVG